MFFSSSAGKKKANEIQTSLLVTLKLSRLYWDKLVYTGGISPLIVLDTRFVHLHMRPSITGITIIVTLIAAFYFSPSSSSFQHWGTFLKSSFSFLFSLVPTSLWRLFSCVLVLPSPILSSHAQLDGLIQFSGD